MRISYSKNFIKQTKKLAVPVRQKVVEVITVFSVNPLSSQLRNHALRGKYKLYRSIDVTGDIRILYIQLEDEAIFDVIGTHSQLYG